LVDLTYDIARCNLTETKQAAKAACRLLWDGMGCHLHDEPPPEFREDWSPTCGKSLKKPEIPIAWIIEWL